MLPIIILAGGLATRMRPLTKSVPKALLKVNGQPFIFWQLKYLRNQGITEVIICVGYLGAAIQDIVGNGSKFGLKITYSHDGPKLLQTGGAIKKALHLIDTNFFVLYGDSFLPINFTEIQSAYFTKKSPALLTILKNTNQWDKSNILYQNDQLIEYNKKNPTPKMQYIDYGLSILNKGIFNNYLETTFDLSDLYHDLSIKKQIYGYEIFTRFYEIGSFKGLTETERFIKNLEKNNVPN